MRLKLVAIVAVAAIAAAIVWQHTGSREARIERAYASCMEQFGGGAAAAPPASTAPVGTTDPTFADQLGKAMQDLVKGVTSGMSGAVCGTLRDACKADFEGAVCQNALAGFK